MRPAPCLLVLVLATTIVDAIAPQDAQRRPAFGTDASLVYVDVYPRRDGRIVAGLGAADFQVFERGRAQKVELVEFVRFDVNTPDADRRDPASVSDSERQVLDPRNRAFVIYLDPFHTTRMRSLEARQPLLVFLLRHIGARDLFAVMTPDTPLARLTFGRRTETIEAELSRFGAWGLADEASPIAARSDVERRITLCGDMILSTARGRGAAATDALVRRFREDAFYRSLEELVERVAVVREGRTHVLLLTEGWRPGPADHALVNRVRGTQDQTRAAGRAFGGQLGGRTGVVDRGWCEGEIIRLAHIDFEERFRALATRASRTNISFFPIDLGGLKPESTTAETLRTLAENTDGSAFVNSNDVAAGFRQVAEEVSAFYILGYYPTDSTTDGTFRPIEVAVRQPGVSVAARRGYYAQPRAPRLAAAVPAAADLVSDALQALARLGSADLGDPADAGGVLVPSSNRLIRQPALSKGAPSPRAVLQPAGRPEVSRRERMELAWPVVESGATHVVRLLDRRGVALPVAMGTRDVVQPDGTHAVVLDVTLASFAPGDYVIELTASRGEESVRSLVAFRVVP